MDAIREKSDKRTAFQKLEDAVELLTVALEDVKALHKANYEMRKTIKAGTYKEKTNA